MEEMTCKPEPITLAVPLGNLRETDLMAALEHVVEHWIYRPQSEETSAEVSRATTWLYAKYGRLPTTGGDPA